MIHFVEAPNNFYLGARVDPDTHQVIEEDVIYYDARDLTTHGVILGMTGSGKTGLAISILEEAVIDRIPLLIIDPKGDITNMLLAFPDLTPEHFKPWLSPDAARWTEQDQEQLARTVAERWRSGLAEWGITNERIQDYRRAARFSIYTPGSEAGLQVSILQSFSAPKTGWAGNEEALRERISGLVTAILALIGMDAKPVEDREHVLLSNIFEYNWRNGVDLTMESLIVQVQRPPFTKLGVLDLETVFAEKDRFKLAQSLNNIIAAPNFQAWIQGEPLDIGSFLYTPEGIPRATIFYLAHLNESERKFIITLLLNNVLSWMSTLAGSTSLRALLYIDEVFGMFPPYPQNPPTKEPIMRLLKQARAFGIGLLVATQNPKDIDYKGLSNIGTWFIGKLQTENDKARVLEGLDSARDATSALDINVVDRLIGRLGPREFIMHNVHEPNTPILMKSRWAMSYLSGPMTREQVSRLMANQRAAFYDQQGRSAYGSASGSAEASGGSSSIPSASAPAGHIPGAPSYSGSMGQPAVEIPQRTKEQGAPPGFTAVQPVISSAVQQYFLPVDYAVEQSVRQWEAWSRQPAMQVETRQRLLYRPSLLAQAMVRFSDQRTNTYETLYYAFVVPNIPRIPHLNWAEYMTDPFDPSTLDVSPFATAYFAELPSEMSTAAGFKNLQSSLLDWIYQNVVLTAYYNPVLKVYSQAGESRRDFVAKLQAIAREKRDAEVDAVVARYEKRLATLEERYQRKMRYYEKEQDELRARKQEEMLTAGESLFQLMKGRAYYTLSRTSRMRRYTEQSQAQASMIERDLEDIAAQFRATEREMQQALEEVQQKWTNTLQQIDEIRITPYKKDISMMLFGIGWVPYWDTVINGVQVILPASSSGLTTAQDPTIAQRYTTSYGSPPSTGSSGYQSGPRPSGGRAGRMSGGNDPTDQGW
ncbi:MAG: DUF87 domain-containing protein [Anaerolineae bacterium]